MILNWRSRTVRCDWYNRSTLYKKIVQFAMCKKITAVLIGKCTIPDFMCNIYYVHARRNKKVYRQLIWKLPSIFCAPTAGIYYEDRVRHTRTEVFRTLPGAALRSVITSYCLHAFEILTTVVWRPDRTNVNRALPQYTYVGLVEKYTRSLKLIAQTYRNRSARMERNNSLYICITHVCVHHVYE